MKRALWVAAVLVVLAGGFCAFLRMRPGAGGGMAPNVAEVQALSADRDRLRRELQALLTDHAGLDLAHAAEANVLLGVPTRFAKDLVNQLAAGLFSEVRLHLAGLEARAEGTVTVPLAGTLGTYSVFVQVKEVRAVLRPQAPDLRFGDDRVRFRLPVTLAEGHGTAAVDVRWQGRGLAGTVCGNLDVSTVLGSAVKPTTETVAGEVRVDVSGDSVVGRVQVDPLRTTLVLQPTEETWAALEATLTEIKRGKNPVCAAALDRLNTRSIVQVLIDRGFQVEAPAQTFEDVALPARLETSVTLRDRTVTLDARPLRASITPDVLWYGVALEAVKKEAAPPKP